MPLSATVTGGRPRLRIEFDKPSYLPGETIRFRVVIEPPPTAAAPLTVSGQVKVPGWPPLPVAGTTSVTGPVTVGPFTHPDYDITADADDPLRFVARPKGAVS